MRIALFSALVLGLTLAPAGAAPERDVLDDALAQGSFERADLGWHPRGWWGRYPVATHKLRAFDDLMAEPLATIPYARVMGKAVLEYLSPEKEGETGVRGARPLHQAVHTLGVNPRYGGFRAYSANLTAKETPLDEAILACFKYARRPTTFVTFGEASPYPELEKGVREQAAKLPKPVSAILGKLLMNLLDARLWIDRAFRNVPLELRMQVAKRLDTGMEEVDALDYEPAFDDVLRLWDEASLWYGAMKTVDALDLARRELVKFLAVARITLPNGMLVDQETPLGRIVVTGVDGDGTWQLTGGLLLGVDLGGNDHWVGRVASADPGTPLSAFLELGGDDRYMGKGVSQGVGLTGVGVLLDAGGADAYDDRGSMAQGVGQFGLGALIDMAGDDTYAAHHSAQGCGFFGIGCLFDLAGNDDYGIWSEGQGFGGVGGVGVLADRSGDDTYVAEPDPEKTGRFSYHSEKKVAVSNAQGCAMGRRGDGADGHSWAGGIGLLLDGGGTDRYEAGNWAQGTGYWFGMGCLWDGAGDDTYKANGWASASGAHFCIGVLVDEGGNDTHYVAQNWGPAFGHDFTIALLVDQGGDDTYYAGDSGIAWGVNRSVAALIDLGGNDTYRFAKDDRYPGTAQPNPRYTDRSKPSLYWTEAMSCSLLLDVGGTDTYDARGEAEVGNDRSYVRDGGANNASIFLDVAQGTVDLERRLGSKRAR